MNADELNEKVSLWCGFEKREMYGLGHWFYPDGENHGQPPNFLTDIAACEKYVFPKLVAVDFSYQKFQLYSSKALYGEEGHSELSFNQTKELFDYGAEHPCEDQSPVYCVVWPVPGYCAEGRGKTLAEAFCNAMARVFEVKE